MIIQAYCERCDKVTFQLVKTFQNEYECLECEEENEGINSLGE